jgi:hypothetical protein
MTLTITTRMSHSWCAMSVGEAILPAPCTVSSLVTPCPRQTKSNNYTHTHTYIITVPIVVTLRSTAFWDVTFCGPVQIQNHFWGKALPQSLQGLSEIRNNQKTVLLAVASSLSYPCTLKDDTVWLSKMLVTY